MKVIVSMFSEIKETVTEASKFFKALPTTRDKTLYVVLLIGGLPLILVGQTGQIVSDRCEELLVYISENAYKLRSKRSDV